jgi:membrane protein implicated in regulation of membrane protease activity
VRNDRLHSGVGRVFRVVEVVADAAPDFWEHDTMAALLWLIVGLLLIAAEVLTTDLTLAMLGASALAAAAAAGLGASLLVQLLTFGLVAIGTVTIARPVLRNRLHAGHYVKTNVEALVGTKAIVVSTVDAHGGEVKIGGEVWSARTYDETQVLERGRPVTVMGISGATALVWGDL